MFSNCYSLETVDIYDGITEIGSFAFADCTALTDIKIPKSVTEKNSDAFFRAIKGYKRVAMPSGNVRFLGGKSFNAKMADLGYERVTQSDGSVIDKNGMIHWEKI